MSECNNGNGCTDNPAFLKWKKKYIEEPVEGAKYFRLTQGNKDLFLEAVDHKGKVIDPVLSIDHDWQGILIAERLNDSVGLKTDMFGHAITGNTGMMKAIGSASSRSSIPHAIVAALRSSFEDVKKKDDNSKK